MALDYIIREITSYDSLLFNRATVECALLAIVIVTLIFFVLQRGKRAKEVSLLIHHNKQKEMLNNKSKNWEKGKKRIEKLLYEMTDHMQPGEFINPRSGLADTNKRNYHDTPIYGRSNKMLRDRNLRLNKPKDTATPLDIQELMAVSTLAKRLQARNHHSMRF